MKRYNPKVVEPKWQRIWDETGIYKTGEDPGQKKRYVLEYFPYPSGAAMHVGHVRNYTIGDALARFYRMRGYNVLHPMGWDAFGLPAENYAIKTGISPGKVIDEATKKFKQQLIQMGFSHDWSREINSTDPGYYKWTQWFFILLYKRGLAYQQNSLQWWCPHDKTVLANEQVEAGRCWRCGNEVEKKSLKQWFFKITEYADRLEKDLDDVNWSNSIKTMQRNWIGKSKGAEVEFRISNFEFRSYIMGQKNIAAEDIRAIGGKVAKVTESGHLCVTFDRESAEKFEKLIIDKMEPGFWNEYIGDGVVFIFKHKDGKVERIVLSKDTNEKIRKLGNKFNNQGDNPNERVEDWLINNSWYAEIFPNSKFQIPNSLGVFTTRPDTLFGATFMVLAPEHPLVQSITTEEQRAQVEKYIKQAQTKTDVDRMDENREKTGVFSGAYAINPVNNEKIPIWIADYVLMGYGTGAIMAVPAHDKRDFEFAKKYKIEIREVVLFDGKKEKCFTGEGKIINSGKYDGMDSAEMREKVVADLQKRGAAKEKINYKIRDWLISRQRYWGAPIPIIHCEKCGAQPVPEKDLPVKLPELDKFEPSGDGRSPLARVAEFVNTTCPKCGAKAQRETDTMDGFACSSWYFLRFADPHNADKAFSKEKADFWLPVDDYIGGAEHAVMHLLYARFWTKVMFDAGLINFSEPFTTLRNQGMILAPDGQKMSKSKNNTIEPDGLISQGYGADAVRVMELFIGPYNQSAAWSVEGMGGCFRFLQRVWTLAQEIATAKPVDARVENQSEHETKLISAVYKTVKKVTMDIENLAFNTAIASMMELTNTLYGQLKRDLPVDAAASTWKEAIEIFVRLLAPFAPHIAEEMWHDLGNVESVHLEQWPSWDPELIEDQLVTIVVQVNGKVRASITLSKDLPQEEIIELALANERVKKHLNSHKIVKTIKVPGKLVNFVVKN